LPQEDIDLDLAMLPGWREHQGAYVLIHGGKVHGFFPDHHDALLQGFTRFRHVAFLAKELSQKLGIGRARLRPSRIPGSLGARTEPRHPRNRVLR